MFQFYITNNHFEDTMQLQMKQEQVHLDKLGEKIRYSIDEQSKRVDKHSEKFYEYDEKMR